MREQKSRWLHGLYEHAAGRRDPLIAPLGEGAPVFHWHLDTFTLPAGPVHLAESDRTALQAFRLGRATYGIQFHFEADRALVEKWVAEGPGRAPAEQRAVERITAVDPTSRAIWMQRFMGEERRASRPAPVPRRKWWSSPA